MPARKSDPARILAPVDRVEEVEVLAEAGAGELYGGVRPRDWAGRQLSPDQRTFASAHFPSEEAFRDAAAEARRLSVPLHLTLNAPLYDPADYGSLLALAERAAVWGVAGVIAADLGLLLRLAPLSRSLEITLSTTAGALNRGSFAFYRRFGIARAVLPRHLGLDEMASLVGAHPDLAFEAFVLVGRCPNEEGYCTFQHTSPDLRWPCEIPYTLSDEAGSPLPPDHPVECWHRSWTSADRRLGCGLCAIPRLRDLGVSCFKIVGRGGPTSAKEANVRLVAAFLAGDRSGEEAREAYRLRFGRPCHPLACYVPELHPERGSRAPGGA